MLVNVNLSVGIQRTVLTRRLSILMQRTVLVEGLPYLLNRESNTSHTDPERFHFFPMQGIERVILLWLEKTEFDFPGVFHRCWCKFPLLVRTHTRLTT